MQVQVGGNAPLHFQQRFHGKQARVTHVHMTANRQQALGDRPVAVGEGAIDEGVLGELWLKFPPQGNAFEQRAALVDTGQAIAQCGVHVEMRVYKWRAKQVALRVYGLQRRCHQPCSHLQNLAMLHRDRHSDAPVGQVGVVDEQIKQGEVPGS